MTIFCTSAEIAANIRERAKAQNIAVTIMLNTLHIGENRLRDMEIRGTFPRIDTLAKIAEFLGCTVNNLIYKES